MKSRPRRKETKIATGQATSLDDFVAIYNLAVSNAQQSRFEEAARLFAAAAKLQPAIAQVHLAHGKILAELGRVDEALDCYNQVLMREPGNIAALNDNASALLQVSKYQEALSHLDRLLAIEPSYALAHYNRAAALRGLSRPEEALTALEMAIAAKPDLFDALFARGLILEGLGRSEESLEAYTAAVAGAPGRAEFWNNQGKVLLDFRRLTEALVSFDRALAIAPTFTLALVNRGQTLGQLDRTEEELACLNTILSSHPQFNHALISRGITLHKLKRYQEALASLDQALTLDPGQVSALQERGSVLLSMGFRQEAVTSLSAALAIMPDCPDTLHNRGIILRIMNRFEEAAQDFARVLELIPGYPYAEGNLLSSRLNCCDWTGLDQSAAALTAGIMAGQPVANPFQLFPITNSSALLLDCARKFVADKYKPSGRPWTPPAPRAKDRIRVAYLSGDFQRHATAFLMAGVLEAHDQSCFETIAISLTADDGSPMRRRLMAAFSQFIDASGMTDSAIIAMLRDMQIDIAVDLKGFTSDARPSVFVERVAPVQVNYLGYTCTWGSDCMDYLIADELVIPPGQEVFYTEKIVYLPDTYQPNDRARVIADLTPTRAELGLPAQGFVFCSFNANFKVMPEVFDIWLRLLQKVEGSVLWLLESNQAAATNLRREAAARGLAAERLVFAGFAEPENHLARQRLADLFLDTLPFNAHTTASDALWAGLPVLTCVGQAFPGRVAASVLQAVGLPELITHSPQEYEAMALKLATNPRLLAELKGRLAQTRLTCALFDTKRFCRHIEAAFVGMHERYESGEPPSCFTIGPISAARYEQSAKSAKFEPYHLPQ